MIYLNIVVVKCINGCDEEVQRILLSKIYSENNRYVLSFKHIKLTQIYRTPVVCGLNIASWVLLKPPALSGCILAAYMSAAVSSSESVPSGNIKPSHNVRATKSMKVHSETMKISNKYVSSIKNKQADV